MNTILGAGLSGLICGALNAQATIYERNPKSFTEHRAVLRFRDNKIARALGLDFRKVTVRKAIWYDGKERQPTPRLANWYSRKVRGVVTENSLWNLASAERYIAPDDLHAVLADICGARVRWNHPITQQVLVDAQRNREKIISTIPLPMLLELLCITINSTQEGLTFAYSPIYVSRYNVDNCDVHQTVYFPEPELTVYRATLTGSLLTIEGTDDKHPLADMEMVARAFGLLPSMCEPGIAAHKQSFGKIAPVPNGPRGALLHRLTQEFGIYSLGRYATWRNILLDDVYDDIAVIRRMMSLGAYDAHLERTRT